MVDIRGGQVLEAQPTVVASIHDNGIVLFHTGNGQLFSANRTGARIWQGIVRHLTVDAMAAEISSEYQIAADSAREHTVRFLTELMERGLVVSKADR